MSIIYISKRDFAMFNKCKLWELSLKLWRENANYEVKPETVYLNLLINIKNFLLSKKIMLHSCPLEKLCVYNNNINYINSLMCEILHR